ncbi:MAG: type II/IV secretion system ATPase subunit [Nanoarchaeota archaeon]
MGLFNANKKSDSEKGFKLDESSKQGGSETSTSSVIQKADSAMNSADDEDDALKNTKVYFKLDLRPKIIDIPTVKDVTKVNIKYDLIPPHSSCHIFWDNKNAELVYYIEEPVLTDVEREILQLVTLGLEEMINISFITAAKNKMVVKYLEHNVQSILSELGAKVSMETYQKLMYYIYRDFIGLNEIEPLLRDYYIEDIECNGSGTPVYIVHRKFRNLKTNVIYKEPEHLTIFVEKIAQKCGRYVSYAQPLLDGTLADGSRVNATYSSDVTTRGPTFTIRKFTKDPWMPTSLIKMGTTSAESFAFFWLAVEHTMNIITIGETGAGKTTMLNSLASFVPDEARITSIEDTRELNLSHDNWLPAVTREGFGITNVTGEKYGEVTLFDLLKESFRQNPDYVIVGEVRDKETYVLFQGMASGHSCFSTFHAASVETLVKRLETPPISLPSSLVESMNIVVVMTHIKEHDKNLRRLREIDEIVSAKDEKGNVEYNAAFTYQPLEDKMKANDNMYTLELISKATGAPIDQIKKELQLRTQLLQKLADQNVTDYREFSNIVNRYYNNPKAVLEKYEISGKSLYENMDDSAEAKDKSESKNNDNKKENTEPSPEAQKVSAVE